MIPRRLPPVASPLTGRAIWQGVRGLFGSGASLEEARGIVMCRYPARDVLLVDSGTSALALALRVAADWRKGRAPVALPAWGCYDLATAADLAGLPVVLYDVDPGTLGPDWDSLERALAAGPAAVVVVHPYGLPVDLSEVSRRSQRVGAMVIEDAAQAVGATVGGHPVGTQAPLGVLSFGRGKGWTGGGGGALLLNESAPSDLRLPESASLASARHGTALLVKLLAQWLLARPALYILPSALPFLQLGVTTYRAARSPTRPSPVITGTLAGTAPLQASEAQRRRMHAARLLEAVRQHDAGRVPATLAGGDPGWLRFPLLPGPRLAGRADGRAAKALGIMPTYPIPLCRLPGFATQVENRDGGFPGSEELARQLRTLPTHGLLQERDLARLVAWLAAA